MIRTMALMASIMAASVAIAPAPAMARDSVSENISPFTNPLKGSAAEQAAACADGPVEAFGRYLGDYTFMDWQIQPDFSGWNQGQGGEWTFHCLGEGQAVQDFWRPRAGGFGATLRMVDPETGAWDVVFTGEGSQKMSHLTAKQLDDGSIEMHYVIPAFDPLRRITFSPPDETGFDWMMSISTDGGETWQDVYRMRADRK